MSIRSGWEALAREMNLANHVSESTIRVCKQMFYAGAMYVATHREDIDAYVSEGLKAFDTQFDSNTGEGT